MLLTVLTPTYNRANTLKKLYDSLLQQTCKDFEWLIVDDGSFDETKDLIDSFIKENKIIIKYVYKKNGGKHTALNLGIELIQTELTIIVDSDDYLTGNAIDTINNYYELNKENKKIAFYSYLRVNRNGKILCKPKKNNFVDNYLKIRIKNNLKGDMAEVFVNKILKNYRFLEFDNEKFISEDTLWIEIAKKYDTLFVNIPIYVCDYLTDGLTKNDKKYKFKSPFGSMLRGIQLMYKDCGIVANIKGAIIYNCYKIEAGKDLENIKQMNLYQKTLISITKPLGVVFNHYWKKKR